MNDLQQIISRLSSASQDDQEQVLSQLDEMGFFMLPDETWNSYSERLTLLLQKLREIEAGNIPQELHNNRQYWKDLPEELIAEANRILAGHYKFCNNWSPAFFSGKETGHFSAGVQLEVDETYPLIFLHDAFAKKNSHFGYDRAVTLAHELIHAARMFFPHSRYEEYFTCHLYASPLRRWMGNLFRSKYLIILFAAGFFSGIFSLALKLPWGSVCFILPLLILLYEIYLHLRLAGAYKKLHLLQLDPLPVLLRLTDREIFALGRITEEEGLALAQNSLRWKIFFRKFRI